MDKSKCTLVALATFNEIENLPSLVEEIHSQLPAAELLIVDDGSPDGTGKWCEQYANSHDWFQLHSRSGKLGLGSAIAGALQHAVEQGYREVITLDADWSHPPDRLPALLSAAENADVVIGSRYCPGGDIQGWPRRRRIASRLINRLAQTLIGLPMSDCSGNYRLYRTAILQRLDWDNLKCDGYAHLEEILWHLDQLGANFVEVPIVFTDRRAGESKINLAEVRKAIGTLSRLAWRRVFS